MPIVIPNLDRITPKRIFTPNELFRLLCDNKDDLGLTNENIAVIMSLVLQCPLSSEGTIDLNYPDTTDFIFQYHLAYWFDMIDHYIALKN